MGNQIAARPSYWASVSGGKDSLMMLHLILNNLDRYPLDGVVHFELETDYPFIKNVVDEMEERCTEAGILFFRIKPRRTWTELYKLYGYPSKIKRWCNGEYKMDCLAQLDAFLAQQGRYLVQYIGFCADEQLRFKYELNDRGQSVRHIYPLAEMGIQEEDVWKWAREQPIFNDYYKYNFRCGCMGCPMARKSELAYLLLKYPDIYENIMRMAKETEEAQSARLGRKITTFHGDTRYDAEYTDNIVRTKWFPPQEKTKWQKGYDNRRKKESL